MDKIKIKKLFIYNPYTKQTEEVVSQLQVLKKNYDYKPFTKDNLLKLLYEAKRRRYRKAVVIAKKKPEKYKKGSLLVYRISKLNTLSADALHRGDTLQYSAIYLDEPKDDIPPENQPGAPGECSLGENEIPLDDEKIIGLFIDQIIKNIRNETPINADNIPYGPPYEHGMYFTDFQNNNKDIIEQVSQIAFLPLVPGAKAFSNNECAGGTVGGAEIAFDAPKSDCYKFTMCCGPSTEGYYSAYNLNKKRGYSDLPKSKSGVLILLDFYNKVGSILTKNTKTPKIKKPMLPLLPLYPMRSVPSRPPSSGSYPSLGIKQLILQAPKRLTTPVLGKRRINTRSGGNQYLRNTDSSTKFESYSKFTSSKGKEVTPKLRSGDNNAFRSAPSTRFKKSKFYNNRSIRLGKHIYPAMNTNYRIITSRDFAFRLTEDNGMIFIPVDQTLEKLGLGTTVEHLSSMRNENGNSTGLFYFFTKLVFTTKDSVLGGSYILAPAPSERFFIDNDALFVTTGVAVNDIVYLEVPDGSGVLKPAFYIALAGVIDEQNLLLEIADQAAVYPAAESNLGYSIKTHTAKRVLGPAAPPESNATEWGGLGQIVDLIDPGPFARVLKSVDPAIDFTDPVCNLQINDVVVIQVLGVSGVANLEPGNYPMFVVNQISSPTHLIVSDVDPTNPGPGPQFLPQVSAFYGESIVPGNNKEGANFTVVAAPFVFENNNSLVDYSPAGLNIQIGDFINDSSGNKLFIITDVAPGGVNNRLIIERVGLVPPVGTNYQHFTYEITDGGIAPIDVDFLDNATNTYEDNILFYPWNVDLALDTSILDFYINIKGDNLNTFGKRTLWTLGIYGSEGVTNVFADSYLDPNVPQSIAVNDSPQVIGLEFRIEHITGVSTELSLRAIDGFGNVLVVDTVIMPPQPITSNDYFRIVMTTNNDVIAPNNKTYNVSIDTIIFNNNINLNIITPAVLVNELNRVAQGYIEYKSALLQEPNLASDPNFDSAGVGVIAMRVMSRPYNGRSMLWRDLLRNY